MYGGTAGPPTPVRSVHVKRGIETRTLVCAPHTNCPVLSLHTICSTNFEPRRSVFRSIKIILPAWIQGIFGVASTRYVLFNCDHVH